MGNGRTDTGLDWLLLDLIRGVWLDKYLIAMQLRFHVIPRGKFGSTNTLHLCQLL